MLPFPQASGPRPDLPSLRLTQIHPNPRTRNSRPDNPQQIHTRGHHARIPRRGNGIEIRIGHRLGTHHYHSLSHALPMRVKPGCNEHDLHRPSHEAIIVGRRDVESLVEGHVRREGGDDRARRGGEIGRREDLDAVLGRVGAVGALLLQERAGVAVVTELGIADEKRRGRKRRLAKKSSMTR